MERLEEILKESLEAGLYQMIVSHPRRKGGIQKIKIRPVMVKGKLLYQESRFTQTQVFHTNKEAVELTADVQSLMGKEFKQLEIHTKRYTATALVGKKGNLTLKKRQA